MTIRESSYGTWTSSRSFLWVASGAAIGIGNIARLPYYMGEYGGIVFLLVYLAALLLLSLPVLLTEWMLGRWMREDLILGFSHLARSAGARHAWWLLGGCALACGLLVLSYYSVIAGWSMAYGMRAAGGLLGGIGEEQARATFLQLAQDPERGLSWHTIFMVVACIIVAHGFRDGIERAAMRLVPAAFIIAIVLCVYAFARGDATAAAAFLLTPDFGKLGWRGVLEAVHQAFFTLTLGMGAMIALGSYLPANAPLARLGLGVILIDTVFSLVSGVAVFAIVFSAGVEPAPGLALIFQVLPRALAPGFEGAIVAELFFVMIFMVTMTSAVALLEPVTRYLMDRRRYTRVFAAASSALVIWYLGLATLMSFGVIQDARLYGRNAFEWVQWLTASWLAPGGALLLCVFVSRIMPAELSRAVWGERDRWLFAPWLWSLRYPARLGLIAVLLYATGAIDWLASLWLDAPPQ